MQRRREPECTALAALQEGHVDQQVLHVGYEAFRVFDVLLRPRPGALGQEPGHDGRELSVGHRRRARRRVGRQPLDQFGHREKGGLAERPVPREPHIGELVLRIECHDPLQPDLEAETEVLLEDLGLTALVLAKPQPLGFGKLVHQDDRRFDDPTADGVADRIRIRLGSRVDQLFGGFDVAHRDGQKVAHNLVLDPQKGLFGRIVGEFGDRSGVFVDRPPLDQLAERMHEGPALGQGVVSETYVGLGCGMTDIGHDR